MQNTMRNNKMSRKTIEALVFMAAVIFSTNSMAQDCGCGNAGFAGGTTSLVQAGLAPQTAFADFGQPAFFPNSGATGGYDSSFGLYASNCGRGITNSQAAGLWSNYCSENCSLNLPYQPQSRAFGGPGIRSGHCGRDGCGIRGCGCGKNRGGSFDFPTDPCAGGSVAGGYGGGGYGGGGCHGRKRCGLLAGLRGLFGCGRFKGGAQFAQPTALVYPSIGQGYVGGGCHGGGHGCRLRNRLFGRGYGWGGGAGLAGSYGQFLDGGQVGFGGYGLPIANAGSYGGFAGGHSIGRGCLSGFRCKLKSALAGLIGCGRRGAVSNQVFQSYYADVGAGPSYFDYAIGHEYGTGDFGIQTPQTFASQVEPMQFAPATQSFAPATQNFVPATQNFAPASQNFVPTQNFAPGVQQSVPGTVPVQQPSICPNCNGAAATNSNNRNSSQQFQASQQRRTPQAQSNENAGRFVGGPNRVPVTTAPRAPGSIVGESVPLGNGF